MYIHQLKMSFFLTGIQDSPWNNDDFNHLILTYLIFRQSHVWGKSWWMHVNAAFYAIETYWNYCSTSPNMCWSSIRFSDINLHNYIQLQLYITIIYYNYIYITVIYYSYILQLCITVIYCSYMWYIIQLQLYYIYNPLSLWILAGCRIFSHVW